MKGKMMKIANIEKRLIIDSHNLSGQFYFNSILQEAYANGLLNEYDIENMQLQCISLLANKCERYNMGVSSSIRIEIAERIMKSNLYTIGLYLKTLPDPDYAVYELKTVKIYELYERGRKLIDSRFNTAKIIYHMVQKNKLDTPNHSYVSTLGEEGIGTFFNTYDLEYDAHDIPASIDYQLCNPVDDLIGIEFIHKYLENLYLENEFCMNFSPKNIHRLLYGYDRRYEDLLINVFEQVLTVSLGCALAGGSIRELKISQEDIQCIYEKLQGYDKQGLMLSIQKAIKNIYEELDIRDTSLKKYIERSLPKIASNIEIGLKLNTLNKVFINSVNPDLESKIHFESGVKMDDEEYRKLEEYISLFNTLEDIEIAVMIRRHPFYSDIQAVDISEKEHKIRLYLKRYISELPDKRREQIIQIEKNLMED
ncbi:hypothetical protein SAMN02745176_00919 [Lutispora thermophila DSM 19022]|uniref:Uncharacterized protein n=2 Tax=Lutispora TaxID=667112 RepID=A0A1M6CYP4_9FIRM|nr:hypothetical protein SAMN02745176_00919 [Lutispora thermophila DSM 19022]